MTEVLVAAALFGSPCVIAAGVAWVVARRLRGGSRAVPAAEPATVLEVRRVGRGKDRENLAKLRFVTRDGQEIVTYVRCPRARTAEGDLVPVRYDPRRPKDAWIPRNPD